MLNIEDQLLIEADTNAKRTFGYYWIKIIKTNQVYIAYYGAETGNDINNPGKRKIYSYGWDLHDLDLDDSQVEVLSELLSPPI